MKNQTPQENKIFSIKDRFLLYCKFAGLISFQSKEIFASKIHHKLLMIIARFCLCVAAITSATLLLIYICINEIETEDHTGPPHRIQNNSVLQKNALKNYNNNNKLLSQVFLSEELPRLKSALCSFFCSLK